SMTVDPVDDCRFWYTTEYMAAGGFWATRIGAFRFSACDVPITASGTTISATEGASFSGTVATFTDPDTSATASEYTATIDWGDTTPPSVGTVSGPTGGPFTVSGTHTYAEEGTYTITVTITDVDTPSNTATATSTANVADAALTAGTLTLSTGVEGVTPVNAAFTFPDANTGAPASDFTATISWGDGSPSSTGTITGGPGNGPYTVSGSHTYSSTGFFTITTTATDHPSSSTATCQVLIFAFAPGGGSFVVGDLNSVVG